jgi:hypothetical protein
VTDRDDIDLLSEHFAQRTRETALTAPAVSPDDMAKAQRLAQIRGVPPLAVAQDLPHYDEQDRLDRLTALAKAQPKVGTFLQDPQNATLAKGEEDKLGVLGRVLAGWHGSIFNAPMRGLERAGVGEAFKLGDTSTLASLWHTITDTLDQTTQRPVRDLTAALHITDDRGENPFGDPLGFQSQAEQSLGAVREIGKDQQAKAEAIGKRPAFGDFLRNPNQAIEQLFAYYGNQGTQSAPAIALAVAARNPEIGGALMGGTTGAQTYADLRADGVDRSRAAPAAIESGFVESALGSTGLEAAMKPGVRALVTGPLTEAGTEGLTQWGQNEFDDLARGRKTPLADKVSQLIDAAALGLGFGVGEKVGSGAIEAVAGERDVKQSRQVSSNITQALRSGDNASRVAAITEAAANLKLGKLSPQTLATFVDHVGGGNVYLAPDQARTLFQSERMSADQALGEILGSADALAVAEASGGDVVIPMALYASRIAQLPNAAEIAKHVRLHPEDYSAADLDAGKAEEDMAATFGNTDAAAERAKPEDGDTIERIRQDVLGQLQATNRYAPADAERQAKLYAAVFRTLGQRTGQDAGALYDRYALRIRGSKPDILRQKPNTLTADLDSALTAARAGQMPSEADAFGPSLIEFLREKGIGAADGMEGEIRRLAESERVGRGGQRRLFRSDDAHAPGLDRAREAAAEAGYLSPEADLSDFLELLDQDIGGKPVYSSARENRALVDKRNDVLNLQGAIAEAFGDVSNEDLAKLSNQEIADRLFPETLDQGARELDFGGRADEQLDAEYDALPATEGGRRLDTDLVRELSPEYRADRTLSSLIHKAASTWTKARFLRMLAKPVSEGRDRAVMFTAGGGGSGKSTAVQDVLGDSNADVIYDGTLSNLTRARADIEAALASGRDVRIAYVYRSPKSSAASAIGRAIRSGRPVPVSVLAEAHAKATQVVKALALEYADDARVGIVAINNDGEAGKAERMPIGAVPEVSQNEAESVFRAALEEARANGAIDEALYAAFDGRSTDPEVGAGDHRQSESKRQGASRNTLNQNPAAGGVSASVPRGSIGIAPDHRMSITLLEGADLSTFLHESGHFFLEVLADLAADTPALAGDFDALLQWSKVEGGTPEARAAKWASMSLDEKRPMHEQIARGFELYLAEGKAPSVELASAFARFKSWMLAVYKALSQLDVKLTPEVRGVFDRLLATDEEIELVEQRQGIGPLVAASEFKGLGLTETQWADYQAMLEAASEEGKAEVFAKLHKAYQREAQAWWKEERAKVRTEVADEFEAEPMVRAWRVLAGRKVEGLAPALAGLKLDRDALLATYAKDYVQGRLKPLGVYAVKGGVHPDTAAAMLGLPSGDALVQGLATVKERIARVDAETDARMRERHPDPLTDGSLPELAERAVHNSARVKALQFELDLLAKLAGQPVPKARAIRLFAQRQIAGVAIKRLLPNAYLAAERKAAREATKAAAKGDYAEALKFKRDQAVQAVLYSEARAALDQVESHVDYARKFDKPSTRQRIGKAGGDLLEMIDGVLAAYSFRPQSDKARERAATLRQWYDRMLAQGVEPQVDPKVLATIESARLTHYRELTVGELGAAVEIVKQLEHQAKEANEIRLAGDKLQLEVEAGNLSAAILTGLEHRGPPPISNTLRNTPVEVTKKGARFLGAVLLRLRTLAHWVDGEGNVEGAFHRLIVRPLDRAQAAYLDAMADYGQKVIGLFDEHLKGQDLTAPIWIASLNQNLTKADILAAALNTGNASNLQRLRDGMGWGDVQMTEIMQKMGRADWQFVQSVWDTLESLWPQIAEQHKRLNGIAPPKIDALPVQTPWGTLRGGYYPVMYDKDSVQWEGVFGKADESLFDPMAMTALPAQGHTKSRVDQARIPLKLDLAGIPAHLSNVLKDLTHRETLIGMRKLLKQPEVIAALHETLGPEASRFLNDKLKHVATDQVYQFAGTMKAVAGFSHGLRRHVGVMAMGYSVATGIKQVLGFSTALEVLTARYGIKAPKILAKGYLEMLRGRGASVQAVRSLSGEMRHRLDTVDADVRNLYQQYLAGRMAQGAGAKVGRAYDAFRFHAFAVIRYAQGYLVDIPTWLAAHEGALQQGLTGDAAVAAADDVMIASQGAGGAKDQALIEGNIPGVELFTMFYSYANAYFNRQMTLGRDVGKSLQGGPGQFFAELPLLSARFACLSVVPVILEELISQAIGQSDGPDDDDNLAAYYGLRVLAYQFYGVPILRDFLPNKLGTQKGAYRISPAQSAMDSLGKLWDDAEKTAQGDAPEARKAARDAVNAVGYTFGLPLAGPWKHVDYLWRYFEGEEDPDSVPEFAAAVATGKREQQ